MAVSFESRLMEASSAETLKIAKQLLKSSRLSCAYRDDTGMVRAVFQEGTTYTHTAVRLGEPPSAQCSCSHPETEGLCPHAIAAIMYCTRFRVPETEPEKDTISRYAGMKDESLESLAGRNMDHPEAQIIIEAESEFPHVPSKWESMLLSVKLHTAGRDYVGNINNLRKLCFEKSLALYLKLNMFSLQDQQILHFLAVFAEVDGSQLRLNSEMTAEFFHCLVGFDRFELDARKLIIHNESVRPVILKKRDGNNVILTPAIMVGDAPLAIHSAKMIVGRSGCWIGRQGEYWWMPATLELGWLRNFFRTGEQRRNYHEYQKLMQESSFPIEVVEVDSYQLESKKPMILLSGKLLPDGFLMKTEYLYDNRCFENDHGRLARDGKRFWLRDEKAEQTFNNDLKMFGFSEYGAELRLDDSESIGVFLDRVLPMWLQRRNDCCLDAHLARLCRGGAGLPGIDFSCTVLKTLPDRFILGYTLQSLGVQLGFQQVLKAVKNCKNYVQTNNASIAVLSNTLSTFLSGAENVLVKIDDKKQQLELPRCAVHYWKHIARDIPGAIPEDFALLPAPGAHPLAEMPVEPIARFQGELRKYQQEGVNWMRQLIDNNYNVVLADEMGLGKTVQLLALLAEKKVSGDAPAMIICPSSLVENWKREAAKFVPDFKVITMNCQARNEIWQQISQYDLVVASYAVIRLDADQIKNLKFSYLILDEAQHIKNPNTANAQYCKAIRADHKLVLTGTPLENSSDDLWSIFDFLHPGLLGNFSSFHRYYSDLAGNPHLQEDLAARVTPFILRRTKANVCQELPPKQEYTVFCELDPLQRELYDKILTEGRMHLDKLAKTDSRANFEVLTALLRLRQVCCHPALLPDNNGKDIPAAKFELLKEMIHQHIDSGKKMLLFSQFTSLLALLRKWLDSENIRYEYLDGSTRNRQDHVDSFNQTPEIPIFLLSLKAGGTGLNLTSADTVIIYDPWWNPAVELQAADRTHRIGQTKPVSSIKLLVKDTIEEKILALQDRKQEIFDNVIENPAANADKLSMDDLRFLLA